jgi:undecaprenyl-diphosphatase
VSEVLSGTSRNDDERLVPIPNRRQTSITIAKAGYVRPLVLLGLAIVWLAALLTHSSNWDRSVFAQIYELGGPSGIELARIVTHLGKFTSLFVLLAAAAFGLLLMGRGRAAITLVAISLSCRLVVDMQKAEFALPRPHPSLHHVTVHSYAFPSGHSANSMATFLAIALLVAPKGRARQFSVAIALICAFAVGLSRIVLGVHWPSDVVGGWAFASFWVIGALWLADRLGARTSGRP